MTNKHFPPHLEEKMRELAAEHIAKQGWKSSDISYLQDKAFQNGFQKAVQILMTEYGELQCPYCMEFGFDKMGFKIHLNFHCVEFANQSIFESEQTQETNRRG